MDTSFKTGFEKVALDKSQKENIQTAGMGALASLGAYALFRNPKAVRTLAQRNAQKNGLARIVETVAPTSKIRKVFDKLRYGADEIHYTGGRIPKSATKTNATVLHTQTHTPYYVKGKAELGSMRDKGVKTIVDKKDVEMRLLDKIESNRPTTIYPGKSFRGEKGLKKLEKSFKKDNFFIKPNGGENSGTGGVGFLTRKDLKRTGYSYAGINKLPLYKQHLMRQFLNNPKKFTVQQDMGILKDQLTGKVKEFRIHAFGKDVVDGASMLRGGNITSMATTELGHAEKHLKKVLNKLPKKFHNSAIAADVARTKDGYKVVELNAGTGASGFLDTAYMSSSSPLQAIRSTKVNQAVYKHMTGKDTQLVAGAKAIGAGGLTALGLKKYKVLKEE